MIWTMKPSGETASPKSGTALLTAHDLYLFNEGTYYRAYEKLGAHLTTSGAEPGTSFGVWAPNARQVSVIGNFNGWNPGSHPLQMRENSGIWEGFVPGVGKGSAYKYHITSWNKGFVADKADPFGFLHEQPPGSASVVWDLDYVWSDGDWLKKRGERNSLHAPMSIYEVHLGSWMRMAEEHNRPLTYREIDR